MTAAIDEVDYVALVQARAELTLGREILARLWNRGESGQAHLNDDLVVEAGAHSQPRAAFGAPR
jgi:hypothetical protein